MTPHFPERVAQSFDRIASLYDEVAVVPREIAARLLEKLDHDDTFDPATVIDIGAGTGSGAAAMLKRFPASTIQLVDLSSEMLVQAKHRLQGYQGRVSFKQAEAAQLPVIDRSTDLIFSNLMLPWRNQIADWLDECRRILKPQGRLIFSTFGPDTLYELRASWEQVTGAKQANVGVDMHVVGDELLRAGFSNPVVDVERLTVTYPSLDALLAETRALGLRAILSSDRRWPGRRAKRQLADVYNANFREGDRIWLS